MIKTQVSQLYVSIFNRASEGSGNAYWKGLNLSSAQIADEMLATADAAAYFGTSLDSNQAFVEHIYLNTLNKTVEQDAAGIAYWVNLLATYTRGEVVSGLVDAISTYAPGALNYDATDSATVAAYNQFTNRVEISDYAADTIAIVPADYATSMSFNGSLTVTDDYTTVATAKTNLIPLSSQMLSNQLNGLGAISNLDTYGVLTLDSSVHWGETLDTITYSFNYTIPTDYYSYPNNELIQGWEILSTEQQNAVNLAMNSVNELLGITLQEVSSGGMIQFNLVNMDTNTAGFSFMPGTNYDYFGDVFLNTDFNTTNNYGLEAGQNGYTTILHELGHALGLKHPFEVPHTLPTVLDDVNHSIMSYTSINSYIPSLSFAGSQIFMDYIILYPNFYSLYDVAALQSIYGVNTNTNTQDNTYTTSYLDYTIQTIWDAGGTDTIDLSNTTGSSTIDLRAGSINSADEQSLNDVIAYHQTIAIQNNKAEHAQWIADNITALYDSSNLYTGKDNLSIATGTIIENIMTGSGNDTVTDNEVNNNINTAAGDDHIYLGNGGYDYVDGGYGNDTLYLNLLPQDISLIYLEDASYSLTASSFGANMKNIENIHFGDGTTMSPDLLIV